VPRGAARAVACARRCRKCTATQHGQPSSSIRLWRLCGKAAPLIRDFLKGELAHQVLVVGRDLHGRQLRHGAAPLVRHVVDDRHRARIHHLVVVPVVRLYFESHRQFSFPATGVLLSPNACTPSCRSLSSAPVWLPQQLISLPSERSIVFFMEISCLILVVRLQNDGEALEASACACFSRCGHLSWQQALACRALPQQAGAD